MRSEDGYPEHATRDYWVALANDLKDHLYSLEAENQILKERLAEVQMRYFDDVK